MIRLLTWLRGIDWLRNHIMQSHRLRGPVTAAYSRLHHVFDRRRFRARDARELILQRWKGAVPRASTRTLCLFAHFDAEERIEDYVVHYLRALCEQAGAETILVSTARGLVDDSVMPALPWVAEIVVRENIGFDFGSWKVGLELRPDLSRYDRVILVNDSVYGPIYPLSPLLEKLPRGRPAILGMTDSYENGYHLQSYFLCANREAVTSQAWRELWDDFIFFGEKWNVIHRYEVGFGARARAAGIELLAAFPYDEVEQRACAASLEPRVRYEINRRKVNPTIFLWRVLVDMGFPFFKGELLKKNPLHLSGLREVPDLIARTSDYPFELIRKHLDRTGEVRFYGADGTRASRE